jgi:hypothetical protein
MAERCKLCHQRLIIINFAIIDGADRSVLIVQRLIAGREIDDREAAMAEPYPWREMKAATVRTTMMERPMCRLEI